MSKTSLTSGGRASLPCQASLFRILPDAVKCAKESGERIYVILSPIYVDDYEEGVHNFGSKGACDVMLPKRDWMTESDWRIDALVDPDGSVFFTQIEDTLAAITRGEKVAKMEVDAL